MNGPEIATWRTTRGLSINRLARALGVEPSTVLRWERGEMAVSPLLDRALRDLDRELRTERAAS